MFISHLFSTFTRHFFLIPLICLWIGVSTLSGQSPANSSPQTSYRIHGGPSLTTLGPGLGAGISVENRHNFYSVRANSTDFVITGDTWEVAFIYGRTTSKRKFQLSAGAGVSVIGGTRYPRIFATKNGEKLEPMIGLPVTGRACWTPVNVVSIGIHGFANINTGQPFGGLALMIRLGN